MASRPDVAARYESSAGELSSPPSGSLSDPDSPSRRGSGRHNRSIGEIIVGNEQRAQPTATEFQHYQHDARQPQPQQGPTYQQYQVSTTASGQQKRFGLLNGEWVQLTAAGLPRKKPGRKPGTVVKPKTGDGSEPKVRKPRKPRDPDAPPASRKRKSAPGTDADLDGAGVASGSRTLAPAGTAGGAAASPQPRMATLNAARGPTSSPSLHPHTHSPSQQHLSDPRYSPKMPKREGGYRGSMQSILNDDLAPQSHSPSGSASTIPVRSSGQSYDPIRGNYDPVRETIASNNTLSNAGSPRGPAQQASDRSPSIASLIDSRGPSSHQGYQPASTQSRFHPQESSSMPPSPSHPPRQPLSSGAVSRVASQQVKNDAPAPFPPAPRPVIKESNFTTIANGPVRKVSDKQKTGTGVSTPLTDSLDDLPGEGESRSILDFGKARPGEEMQAPTIVLNIPISFGETNKYVNFTRMAEDRYGWDALHPRLAANRDRKARIAAAAASLEKVESGRESGDEMSVDLSDAEGSNPENGGTSGPDAPAKPKKKRNFKEDQYDVDDDFVDDSELLWEAQAAASRDGFFVYSGPLVPEPEKPAAGHEERPRRGRGSRGSRGGSRGGATRGGAGSRGGGGPGSRGGNITRKPRITKSEKLQREREKAERESLAQAGRTSANGYAVQPPSTPAFTVSELGV